MQLATIIGTATATLKHPSLKCQKLAIVQPLLADGRGDGFPLLAVDAVGAACGNSVFITSDGSFSRKWLKNDNTPVRWAIVGIKD